MKAAVLFAKDQLEVVDGIEIPSLKHGQVLVRIQFSGVCHSQLMEWRGNRGPDKWLPHLLGHEATGAVEQVGPGVTRFKAGDSVVLGWIRSTGVDAPGAQYRRGDTIINSGPVSTFSTHSIVSENRCYPLPTGIAPDVGVLFGCAILTGAGLVLNDLHPCPGSRVAVLGLGGIGLSALMACRSLELGQVIGIDVSKDKLELAKALGATHTIDAASSDVREAVLQITEGQGVDGCIEAAGRIATIETAFELLNPKRGKLVFASHPPTGQKIAIDPHALISGRQIQGSWGGGAVPERDIPRFADLYQKGVLDLGKLVDKRYALENIGQALTDLEQHRVIRPLIEMPSL